MYLCAKLVGFAATVLSAGTVSSVVIPYLKSTQNDWLFQKDSEMHKQDLRELDKEAGERLEKLTDWFNKFNSAKTTAEELRKAEFAKMQPLFEKIFSTEEEIKKLFEKISETLSNLVKKNEQLVDTSTKKLDAEKREQLQKTLQEKYSAIKKNLQEWTKSLSQISCAIEQKEQKGKCDDQSGNIASLFTSINSLFSSLISPAGGAEAKPQNGQQESSNEETGAKKAEQELEQVKEALLSAIQDYQKQSSRYSTRLAYSFSKERVAVMALVVLRAMVKALTENIDSLKKTIEEDRGTSDTKAKSIKEWQEELESSYKYYSALQKLESGFQWWKEHFQDRVEKARDDRERQTDLARRKRRK